MKCDTGMDLHHCLPNEVLTIQSSGDSAVSCKTGNMDRLIGCGSEGTLDERNRNDLEAIQW